MEYIEVSPAYGRDYKSARAVKADWDANKDFIVQTIGPDCGRMINKQDAESVPGLKVQIRYNRMTRVVIV